MKLIRIITISIITSWWLTSCSPAYYAPNAHNVPLMEEKGNLSVVAGIGTGTGSTSSGSTHFQSSYSPVNNLGIIMNYSTVSGEHYEESQSNEGNGSMLEIGAGYYSKLSPHIIVEIYGIYGIGKLENDFNIRSDFLFGNLSGKMQKQAIQANLGYKRKYFEFSLSFKPTLLKYYNIEGDLIHDRIEMQSYLEENNSYNFIESALTMNIGTEHFKLQIQSGGRYFEKGDHYILGKNTFFNLGLRIGMNVLKKQK